MVRLGSRPKPPGRAYEDRDHRTPVSGSWLLQTHNHGITTTSGKQPSSEGRMRLRFQSEPKKAMSLFHPLRSGKETVPYDHRKFRTTFTSLSDPAQGSSHGVPKYPCPGFSVKVPRREVADCKMGIFPKSV